MSYLRMHQTRNCVDVKAKKTDSAERKLWSFFCLWGLVVILVYFSTNVGAKAGQISVSTNPISNFWEEDLESRSLINSIPADKDTILVIEYQGPKWESVFIDGKCVCENTFWIKANSNYYENHKANSLPIYLSEKFDWRESKRFVVFLPKITKSNSYGEPTPYYTFELWREKNGGVNQCQQDYRATRGSGRINGSGKYITDCLDYYVTCYEVEGISITNDVLKIGDKIKPSIKSDEYLGDFKWRSSNDSVISIDSEGYVVANNSGSATLVLSLDGQDIYNQVITVGAVEKPQDIVLYENNGQKINISGLSGSINWTSLNKDVAVVSDGYVQAVGIGNAVIYGTYGSFTTSFNVTVKGRELSTTYHKMYSGELFSIMLTGTPTEAKWSSDNNKVASVDSGLITAKKPGTATIQVEVGSQTLKCKIEVLGSDLSSDCLVIMLGDYVPLYVLGSSAVPVISSSNEDVVSISNGMLELTGAGKATISYSLGDEVLKCKIQVKKMPAPTGFTYEASSKVIKLKWDEYYNAKSYSVYVYDSDTKAYKLVDTVKKPAYTAKDLEAGQTYIYKVAANVSINGKPIEQELSDKIKCKTEKKDKSGWQTIDGKKYYYKDGFVIGSGVKTIDGSKYVFDTDNVLLTSQFITIDGNKYYLESSGKIATNKEVTDKENNVTYVADKTGILTKKKVKSTTKTVTFNDITMEIPTSWGSVTKDGDSYSYSFGSSIFMIYTDPKYGSLTQTKADSLVKEFKDYCCTSLEVNKSKKYTYDKKISTYYVYTLNLSIPNGYGYGSTSCKGRLTAFEYNGKYYVAVMMVEKSKCEDDSFDEYTEVIKSIKPITKSTTGGTVKKTTGGTKTGGTKSTSTTVYITPTGSKYHYKNPCGNGTYTAVSLSWAIANGYTPCGKCAK